MRCVIAVCVATFFAIGTAVPSASQTVSVDVALVLAADSSGSIDDAEFRLQRRGYAEAVTDASVLAALTSGFHGAVALAYMEWGAPESQHTIVDWTIIDGQSAAETFAARLLAAPRVAFGYNSISNALDHAGGLLESVPALPTRRIIDISGDGPQIGGLPLFDVRAGLLADGVTINALVIVSEGGGYRGPAGIPLDEHYRRDVIGGPGAFVKSVASRAEMADALKEKLILEVAGRASTGRRHSGIVMPDRSDLQDNM